jgi:hypothetical protein
MNTLFRVATKEMEFEIQGSETFVLSEMKHYLPWLANDAPSAAAAPTESSLAGWFDRNVPRGRVPTMQDSILIFGYHMKRIGGKHMFSPTDVKACFAEIGRDVPKSLLQIMGTLKRDHGLLWSPEDRRGVYALSPEGIKRVEEMLGITKREASKAKGADEARSPDPSQAPALRESGEPKSSSERWNLLFKGGLGRPREQDS